MKETVHYCQHIVCMLDLLGQKEMYKELESFPLGDSSPEQFGKLVSFIRSIEYFKKDILSFLKGLERVSSKPIPQSPAIDFLIKTNKNICKIQRFSDGVIVYVPLAATTDSLPISSVLNALLCTASTMLISLAKGNPIRVGIAIGGGVELEDGELFGPVIGKAHEMESTRAIYPRIAVHPNVLDYLNSYPPVSHIEPENLELRFESSMSDLCKSAIKRDFDGEYILDYLGSHVWEYLFRGGDRTVIDAARVFINNQLDCFTKSGNARILEKYKYLDDYFSMHAN